jgi:mycofactocin precursor
MPDTDLQTSEANVNVSEDDVIPSAHPVILSETKDLSPTEAPTDLDATDLDLVLEEELIIEDFTIDGICGVY